MLQSTATFCGGPLRHSDEKETDVLKMTCVTGGLVIAAAAGTLLTGSAAFAQPMGGGCFSSCGAGLNWNGHRTAAHNRIRIRINNRNNNVAVARNVQRQRHHQFERQGPRQRQFDMNPE
jgi:hypothetical protein